MVLPPARRSAPTRAPRRAAPRARPGRARPGRARPGRGGRCSTAHMFLSDWSSASAQWYGSRSSASTLACEPRTKRPRRQGGVPARARRRRAPGQRTPGRAHLALRAPPPSYSSPYHSPYCMGARDLTLRAPPPPPPTLLPTTHPTVWGRATSHSAPPPLPTLLPTTHPTVWGRATSHSAPPPPPPTLLPTTHPTVWGRATSHSARSPGATSPSASSCQSAARNASTLCARRAVSRRAGRAAGAGGAGGRLGDVGAVEAIDAVHTENTCLARAPVVEEPSLAQRREAHAGQGREIPEGELPADLREGRGVSD